MALIKEMTLTCEYRACISIIIYTDIFVMKRYFNFPLIFISDCVIRKLTYFGVA